MNIVIVATAGESLIKFRGPLIREWVKRGNCVTCISIEKPSEIEQEINELGASYYQVSGNRTGTSIIDGLRMIKKYKKAFKELKPDVCFLYMSKPIAFGGLAAISLKIKKIFVFQTGLEIAFYNKGFKNWIIRNVLKHLYKKVQKKSDTVFFMSHYDQQKMIEWKLVDKDKTFYVDGSGVDMDRFKKMPLPKDVSVLMVARLVWSKGIREYFEAAKIVKELRPTVRFALAGGLDVNSEAISESELNDLIKEGVIDYKGYLKDIRPVLEGSSIFVLPSYHEGKGTAILEAQACGRPIVTTDAPGCGETVIDGFNGFKVPVKNGKALAEKILYLIDNDHLISEMGNNAFEYCKKTFSSDIIVNQISDKMNV